MGKFAGGYKASWMEKALAMKDTGNEDVLENPGSGESGKTQDRNDKPKTLEKVKKNAPIRDRGESPAGQEGQKNRFDRTAYQREYMRKRRAQKVPHDN